MLKMAYFWLLEKHRENFFVGRARGASSRAATNFSLHSERIDLVMGVSVAEGEHFSETVTSEAVSDLFSEPSGGPGG